MAFEPAEIAHFSSPEAEQRFLAAYDALRNEMLPADRTERMIDTEGGSTFVVSYPVPGDATPLLILPGHAGTAAGWHGYVEALAGTRTIHTLDTLGDVGRSVQRAPMKAPAEFARWLDAVLDGLAVERVHLAGLSQGGWLALNQAVHSPDRVASLTLSEPVGLEPLNLPRFIWRSFAMIAAYYLPGFLGRGLATLLHTGIRITPRSHMRLMVLGMRTFRSSVPAPPVFTDDQLRSITQPTYLQLASHSEVLKATRVRDRVTALVPDVHVDIVPDASHSVGYDHAEPMIARLRALDDARLAA